MKHRCLINQVMKSTDSGEDPTVNELSFNKWYELLMVYHNNTKGWPLNKIDAVAAASDGSSATRRKDVKQACLLRDNNRCIATGSIDTNVYHKLSPIERAQTNELDDETEGAHIIPFALGRHTVKLLDICI